MTIESEDRKVYIDHVITVWANHCKLDHLLRDDDIPNLVHSILSIFYPVYLSCGHRVKESSEGVDVHYVAEDGCEIYEFCCKDCASRFTSPKDLSSD